MLNEVYKKCSATHNEIEAHARIYEIVIKCKYISVSFK